MNEAHKAADFYGFRTQGRPGAPGGVRDAQNAYYKEAEPGEKIDAYKQSDASQHAEVPSGPETGADHDLTLDALYAKRARLIEALDATNAEIYKRIGQGQG